MVSFSQAIVVIRQVSWVALLILGSVLSACGTTEPYVQTKAMLSKTGYYWAPLTPDNASAGDSAADLDACISGITAQIERVRDEGYGVSTRSREARVLQLLDCMRTKGWTFEYNRLLDEIAVTNH